MKYPIENLKNEARIRFKKGYSFDFVSGIFSAYYNIEKIDLEEYKELQYFLCDLYIFRKEDPK